VFLFFSLGSFTSLKPLLLHIYNPQCNKWGITLVDHGWSSSSYDVAKQISEDVVGSNPTEGIRHCLCIFLPVNVCLRFPRISLI
jgi:hypothetical protein